VPGAGVAAPFPRVAAYQHRHYTTAPTTPDGVAYLDRLERLSAHDPRLATAHKMKCVPVPLPVNSARARTGTTCRHRAAGAPL
jgi:hypothetical protein